METFSRMRGTLYIPLLIQCRSKFNTHRIKPIHLERRILEAVTQPIYHENMEDKTKICSILKYRKYEALEIQKPTIKENKYESFLIREAQKTLVANQVIIAFQPESVNMRRKTVIHNMFVPLGLEPIYFPHDIIRKAIEDTKLKNLHPLIHRQTLLVVGKTVFVEKMLKTVKKMPDLVLLGGVVGDRIFTKQGLFDYAALPEMDVILGQSVGIMATLPKQSWTLLTIQQHNLTRNLDQYIAQGKDIDQLMAQGKDIAEPRNKNQDSNVSS